MRAGHEDSDLLADEAAAWFARMRGPDALAQKSEFEAWLAGSMDHERAYQGIAGMFEEAAVLKMSGRFAPAAPHARARADRGRQQLLALAAVVLACVCLAVTAVMASHGFWLGGGAPAWRELATTKGEIRTFDLADGSLLTLDSSSRVQVAAFDRTPRVRLLAGRARLCLAPTAPPMEVQAGAGRVSATRGIVDVALAGGTARVSLVEGKGEIAPRAGPAVLAFWNGRQALLAGRSFTYAARSFANAAFVPGPTADQDRDWPTGWAEYRATSLGQLVDQANRYAAKPLVVDGPGLVRLEVTGRFHLTDSEGLARRLGVLFGLEVVPTPTAIHLRRR